MRTGFKSFLVAATLFVPACSNTLDEPNPSATSGTSGNGTGGAAGASSTGAGTTGSGGTGPGTTGTGSGGTGATDTGGSTSGGSGGAAGSAGTSGTAGAGGARDAGSMAGSGGASGSAGASGAAGKAGSAGVADSGGAPPGTQDPIIPDPTGACPTFTTGTQTIMTLSTEIVAGTPGATKGPLLFTWHGTGGTGAQALRQLPASIQQDIRSQGGIVIAPSSNGQVRAGMNVALNVWFDGHDLSYADLIVGCAVKNHNIDPRRIYVTGCSAGGLMAGSMLMMRSNYVAAAAPNSGGLTVPKQLQSPTRLPAVMTMHGGSGDTVIVNFETTSHTLQNALKPSGAFLVECNHNSGHCGAPTLLHEKAWEFMKAHSYATKPSPYAGGLPAGFPTYCQIF